MLTTMKPCPPHLWGHAPTVGYFHCGKCGEQINYDDPRYDAMLKERMTHPSTPVVEEGAIQ
jgi:hypothetical protein